MLFLVSLDPELVAFVEARANSEHSSMSDVISTLIRQAKDPDGVEPLDYVKLVKQLEEEDDFEKLRRCGFFSERQLWCAVVGCGSR